jgi:hypothetical protein
MKYLVAQLGARMHYAVPRMLHESGMLSHFYTDICATKGLPSFLKIIPESIRPIGLRRLLSRIPNGIPGEKLTAFTNFGFEYSRRLAAAATPDEVIQTYLWSGRQFCKLILEKEWRGVDGVYTFNGAGLEVLVAARARGLRTVMEQTIAPMEVEMKLLRQEHDRFPGWASAQSTGPAIDEYIARERAEWAQSDLILCGSEFVREGIAACGGPVERCKVVPYGVDSNFGCIERKQHAGPLRVLTVGAIGLRKGSPYVLEVAKALGGQAKFRMVGSHPIGPQSRQALEAVLELTGVVPRSEIQQHFAWADVFLLPSLCEGSATVVYEALAAGLPVVCTPNAGSVVRDGIEGYITPVRDTEAMKKALLSFVGQPAMLMQMSANSRARANIFNTKKYREQLVEIIKK